MLVSGASTFIRFFWAFWLSMQTEMTENNTVVACLTESGTESFGFGFFRFDLDHFGPVLSFDFFFYPYAHMMTAC